MRFPLIIYKDADSDYGALFPDFPGCYTMGVTVEEILENAQDAVETWMLGEPPEKFPVPSKPDAVLSLPDAQGRAVFFVDIDTAFLDNTTQRINITLPKFALSRIDREAKALGLSRSAFLQKAAQAFLS